MSKTSHKVSNISVPYGVWWSSPFAKWQGAFAELHALRFAATVASRELEQRAFDPSQIDYGVLGTTVPQAGAFYGVPWVLGEIGAASVAGPTIAQACATGVRVLAVSAAEIACGDASFALAIAADRVSNGPQIYYPAARGPGGSGSHEAWVLDNMARDPFIGCSMLETAENVAAKLGIERAEQDDVALRRYAQYADALSNASAFQKRFMTLPFDVPTASFTKTEKSLQGDEGVFPTTAEKLASLKPVLEGGTVTYGVQTHPADGNAGMIVTSSENARVMSSGSGIVVDLVAFGQARTERAHMPLAPIPAAEKALRAADLKIHEIAAIKTHNPFIVNDIAFARAFEIDVMTMNNFGCSLVWGHPQAPTALRAVIELCEELAQAGGGYGLFTGCAAGDSAMALIVHVRDAG